MLFALFDHHQLSFVIPNHAFVDRDLTVDDPLLSLHFRVQAVERVEDPRGHRIAASLTAAKEKLMREKVTLSPVGGGGGGGGGNGEGRGDNKERGVLKLEVNARVLGKDKGTPALKSGVKSIGIDRDLEDDSELSDWQGFE